MRILSSLALVVFLPGCAAISALSGEPARDVFELRPPPVAPRQCDGGARRELVIELPKARGTLDSDRIMIRPSALQTQYLPDARWGDTVPLMVQTLMLRSFENYNIFTHVGRAPLGPAGDDALISEVTEFNAVIGPDGSAEIRLAMSAQLVDEWTAKVTSTSRFSASVMSPSTKTSDLMRSFDAASQQLIGQVTEWGLRARGVNPASCR